MNESKSNLYSKNKNKIEENFSSYLEEELKRRVRMGVDSDVYWTIKVSAAKQSLKEKDFLRLVISDYLDSHSDAA